MINTVIIAYNIRFPEILRKGNRKEDFVTQIFVLVLYRLRLICRSGERNEVTSFSMREFLYESAHYGYFVPMLRVQINFLDTTDQCELMNGRIIGNRKEINIFTK